ncbi:MAG: regulatory iron-sulfur-containing complex subunit RicT [Thermodesulfovibrionia bacterium]|nr:regulatory iron-sulfur-containing complex subunit RicT [Thermodesulfovibrionia bacterium]
MPETIEQEKVEDNNNNTTTVVHVRFKTGNKTSILEMNNIDAEVGTRVVAESDIGLSLGTIIRPKEIIEKTKEPLKKVLRIALENDFKTDEGNRAFEHEAKMFCAGKSHELRLDMKVVTTESTLDRKKLIFYFTADSRVDFRDLVRDLAAKFKTRIEMRQIGVRDEVKLIGGIGICGGETCCSRFLTHFEPISIRMAKKQELSINQGKLSGICGRLMCCLNYEVEDPDKKKARAASSSGRKARGSGRTMPAEPIDNNVELLDEVEPVLETIVADAPAVSLTPETEEATPAPVIAERSGEASRQGTPPGQKTDDRPKRPGSSSNKRRRFWKKKNSENKGGSNPNQAGPKQDGK